MSKEAIENEEVQDVSGVVTEQEPEVIETEEAEQVDSGLSPRDEQIQAIIEQQADADAGADTHPVETEQYNSQEQAIEDDGAVEPEQAAAEEIIDQVSPTYKNEQGEWVMDLKVNGHTVTRTVDQIKATEQKNMSADMRLQQAGEQMQKVNARENELKQYEQMLIAERDKQQNNQLSEQDAGLIEKQAREFVDQVYEGNTEEAVAKMAEIMGRPQQPTLDVQGIEQRATANAVVEMEQRSLKKENDASLTEGGDWVKENYPEVVTDPMLYQMVDTHTTVVERDNPNMSPSDVIKKATQEVMARVGSEPASSRHNNKSNIRPIIKPATNQVYQPPKKGVVDNSPAAAIARTKASRQAYRS